MTLFKQCQSLITNIASKQVEFGIKVANSIYDYVEKENITIEDLKAKSALGDEKFNMILQGTYDLKLSDIFFLEELLNTKLI